MSAAARASSSARRPVSRLDGQAAARLFPQAQRARWPSGYLPAAGIAHFLRPGGVELGDVVSCAQEIRAEPGGDAYRDFAADYALWSRGVLRDFLRGVAKDRVAARLLRRYTARDRTTVHDKEVRQLFRLAPYKPAALAEASSPSAATRTSTMATAAAVVPHRGPRSAHDSAFYRFTPYATLQEHAMRCVAGLTRPTQKVPFATFPALRNVIYGDYDSMSALRALDHLSGDGLVMTTELVQHLALYLRTRLDEIVRAEPQLLASSAISSSNNSDSSQASRGGDGGGGGKSAVCAGVPAVPTFSATTPLLCVFGNGRLGWSLNQSGLLPCLVPTVQLPAQATRRTRHAAQLAEQLRRLGEGVTDGAHGGAAEVAHGFMTVFPCTTLPLVEALHKFRPAVVIVEPHVDRDWIADLRGFYSVREVLMLGPVDGPMMASFTAPFLSFGVVPGPESYWLYNDRLQRMAVMAHWRSPMDAPHVAQGYSRDYVDELSSYLVSPNDTAELPCQYRCLSFRRRRGPPHHTARLAS